MRLWLGSLLCIPWTALFKNMKRTTRKLEKLDIEAVRLNVLNQKAEIAMTLSELKNADGKKYFTEKKIKKLLKF